MRHVGPSAYWAGRGAPVDALHARSSKRPRRSSSDEGRSFARDLGLLGRADAGEHEHGIPPEARPPRDVGVEPVADHAAAARLRRVGARPAGWGRTACRSTSAVLAGRRLDRGEERSRTWPPRCRRPRGTSVGVRRHERGPALHQHRGDPQLRRSRRSGPTRRRPRRPRAARPSSTSTPTAVSASTRPGPPTTKTRPTCRPASTPAVVSADVSTSAASASIPTARSRLDDAARACAAELFVTNATALPSERRRVERVGGVRHGVVAAIEHPVEVEQERVVRVGDHRRDAGRDPGEVRWRAAAIQGACLASPRSTGSSSTPRSPARSATSRRRRTTLSATTIGADYLRASPFSVVHLDLAEGSDDPDHPQSRYARAAELLADWERRGALRRAVLPCYYAYEMTTTTDGEGVDRSVRGLICAMELETWGGTVLPHEQVIAGPVNDRLALLRATRTHLSPVYGTLDGAGDALDVAAQPARRGPPSRRSTSMACAIACGLCRATTSTCGT